MRVTTAVEDCPFCGIVRGEVPASIVHEDALTLAFVDLRQFHPGHILVIPKAHLADVRELDDATGAALMRTVARVTRAVGEAFPNEGLSLWHSIGPAAHQEVPHLHIHVHPRRTADGFLRVYPGPIASSDAATRESHARRLREVLGPEALPPPVELARSIAQRLGGLRWGIGGSCLLWHLGLEPAPHDLDVVCESEDFDAICARLAAELGPGESPAPHAAYQSRHFRRFPVVVGGVETALELMAGVQVQAHGRVSTWSFDIDRVRWVNGLPWMQAEDWVTLYTMFDRPARAAALRAFLP